MVTVTSSSEFDADESDAPEFKRLSAEEAQALRESSPHVSPWRVVGLQVVVGVLVALVAWGYAGSPAAGASAMYGAAAVFIPAALFLRGLARQLRAANAGSALVGFFVWEMVKIVLTVVMLFAAPWLILQLNWLALLAGFVVTMKVCWVAAWLRPVRKDSLNKN